MRSLLFLVLFFSAICSAMPNICWGQCRCGYGILDCTNNRALGSTLPYSALAPFTSLRLAFSSISSISCAQLGTTAADLDIRHTLVPLTDYCQLLTCVGRVDAGYSPSDCAIDASATSTPIVLQQGGSSGGVMAGLVVASSCLGLLASALGVWYIRGRLAAQRQSFDDQVRSVSDRQMGEWPIDRDRTSLQQQQRVTPLRPPAPIVRICRPLDGWQLSEEAL